MLRGLGQQLGTQAIAVTVALILVSALLWVGVAFAGYALYLAFLPQTGAPWASALAALILTLGPLGYVAVLYWRAPVGGMREQSEAQLVKPNGQDAAIAMLAKLAQEKPLLAILAAGILGASEVILRNRKV